MTNLFNYIDRKSSIHSLTGATKLVCFVLWSIACMVTYDTRLLVFMLVAGIILFRLSRIKFSDISFMLSATLVFALLNNITVYLFSPQYGCELYSSKTVLFTIAGNYIITAQQLFYHFNLLLKYMTLAPVMLLFVCTTDPSEFAASLNKIGVSYKVAYSVALAMRYIPDIQAEYTDISQAQQARGIEMSKKESLIKRLKAVTAILIPLIISSMDRIETISNAMELRSFGKNRKRTWYMARKFTKNDIIAMVSCSILLLVSVSLIIVNGTRFYNPFV